MFSNGMTGSKEINITMTLSNLYCLTFYTPSVDAYLGTRSPTLRAMTFKLSLLITSHTIFSSI